MTNFQRRVLELLEHGPMRAHAIGLKLWPGHMDQGPANGGPSSLAAAASWQLGKIRMKTKFVDYGYKDIRSWKITVDGKAALVQIRKQDEPGQNKTCSRKKGRAT